jgi:uncharacterized protein
MEEPVSFTSANLHLEGMLEKASATQAVMIAHPHPLYGGDMDNPVVLAVRRAYLGKGYSTLRFNFRGVGKSEGRFDNGVGERQDVSAALAFLADLGMMAIDLAGYSFGAWVNAGLSTGFQRMLMVSPPVAFISFDPPTPIPSLRLIVTGGRDDIAPARLISTCKPQWNPAAAFEVIPDADHFYTGFLKTLEDTIAAHI